ncbi:MAG: sigma-54 dependent transcriptional regulator [Desulfovibrio sp.]|nr:sigma-54 dependent transcriptional regulator [Desulfovibrio sp.]
MSSTRVLFLAPPQTVTGLFARLREVGVEVDIAENMKGAALSIRKSPPAAIFARPALPGFKIEELLAAKDKTDLPPVVVVAENGTPEEAERLLSLGARDYWLEPLDPEKVIALVKSSQTPFPASKISTLGGHKPKYPDGPRIVGQNPAIARVMKLARQVAPSKATVLITGESGTGKEMFARYLHAHSKRVNGPFIAVNCAALPEHLLESELFGHEKGSFTGAIARKLGKFELASGGTILLDEISEMDLALQAKLLRVLQEGEIDRVGGSETVAVDVRVLATTNRDLEDWVKQGKFRQDLYFRLNVIPLRLPSLKDRGDDVIELARFFINMYVKEYDLPPTDLSPEAYQWLREYSFPGNVRELQNLMERAVLLANGQQISPAHFLLENDSWPIFDEVGEDATASGESFQPVPAQTFPELIEDIKNSDPGGIIGEKVGDLAALPEALGGAVIPLHEMERIMIAKGLVATNGNRTQAAELLGISVRTLRNKLNEYRSQGAPVD